MRRVVGRPVAIHLAVVAGMAVLSAALLWPLLHQMPGRLPSWYFDTWMDAWSIWWMRDCVLHAHNPFFAPGLEYPFGAAMYWHNLEPAKTLFGVVLLPWMEPVTAHNLLIWTTFPLAGYTAWLLFSYLLTRDGIAKPIAHAAAFAGACVFTFSRYHLSHAEAHLNLSALEGLPLYLFFFVRYLDAGRRRDLGLLAASALYTALCDYYYLTDAMLLSLAWILANLVRSGGVIRTGVWREPIVRRALRAALAAGVAVSPLLLMLALHASPAPLSPNHGDATYAADLDGFLVPERISGWLAFVPEAWKKLSLGLPGNNEENGYFLGYLTPLLALVAARSARFADGRVWLGIFAAFVVLSLGIELSVDGSAAVEPWVPLAVFAVALAAPSGLLRSRRRRDLFAVTLVAAVACRVLPVTANGVPLRVHVPLPYIALKTIFPFLGRAGMICRFIVCATLALGVLFAAFAARVATRPKHRSVAVLAAITCSLIPCAEYWGRPMTMEPVTFAPIFDQIRAAPDDVAVFTDASTLSEFEQTYHHHPISYARLARVPKALDDFEQSHRLYQILLHERTLDAPVSDGEAADMRAFLTEHHFGYYVAHWFSARRDRFVVEKLHGRELYREGTSLVVYRLGEDGVSHG